MVERMLVLIVPVPGVLGQAPILQFPVLTGEMVAAFDTTKHTMTIERIDHSWVKGFFWGAKKMNT